MIFKRTVTSTSIPIRELETNLGVFFLIIKTIFTQALLMTIYDLTNMTVYVMSWRNVKVMNTVEGRDVGLNKLPHLLENWAPFRAKSLTSTIYIERGDGMTYKTDWAETWHFNTMRRHLTKEFRVLRTVFPYMTGGERRVL